MTQDMFHQQEIAEALRLLCQGCVALTEDVEPGATEVRVGSNELFAVGDEVVVTSGAGEEEGIVAESLGLTGIVLSRPVERRHALELGARLRLPTVGLPWVGRGTPELMPRGPAERFPCAMILPGRMEQSGDPGSHRIFQQDYTFAVYYVEQWSDEQEQYRTALDRAADLFNLIMSDPYLGGTCWHSQVTALDPDPPIQQRLRDSGKPLRVVEITVLARRAEAWQSGGRG